jgi:purine-binding chemotaxis protein CheW
MINLDIHEKSYLSLNVRQLVVIALGTNFFGIDLAVVREFVDIHRVTPVPCCPTHIIGNMNLRGEILTVVDISRLLNPAMIPVAHSITAKGIVIEVDIGAICVMIDTIGDTTFPLDEREIAAASHTHSVIRVNPRYLKGVAPYRATTMSILDITNVVSDLIVDQLV